MAARRGAARQAGEDVRCSGCGVLLARREPGGTLSIHRGDLQATMNGDFHASLVCYRPQCRKLNVVRLTPGEPSPQPP